MSAIRLGVARLARSPRARQVAAVAAIAVGAVGLLALLSYDGQDATWFQHRPGSAPDHNWFGRVGATLAEALLQLFGAAAFLVPFLLVAAGFRALPSGGRGRSPAVVAGQAVLVTSLCALLELLYDPIAYDREVFAPGGVLGLKAAAWARALLNTPGALLLSAAVLASTVVLLTRASFVRSAEVVARASTRGWERFRERPRQRPSPAPTPAIELASESPVAGVSSPPPPVLPGPELVPKAERPAPRKERARTVVPPPVQPPLPMEPGRRGYALPPVELLNEPGPQTIESEQELLERARQITEKFQIFQVAGSVVAIHPGPVVTTFEFKPEAGVKYSKITGMTEDLSLALRAESVRIDRMPGRATVGIEVPNRRQETIYPRELFASERFQSSRSKLTLALGKDISGEVFTAELDRMPHLLIAGATGSGKSVGLNGMITSLLYKATPDEVRFIMIDTKMIELGIYEDIPHLLIPVVTDPKLASTALKWAVREMERRYRQLAAVGARNIAQFNQTLRKEPERTMEDPDGGEPIPLAPLPFIVIVIDELADLFMIASNDVEESIMRLAQMARAVGLHLIIATQRPSVDVITGTIKANFPSRIAFRVSQRVDSRTIIDQQGAEHLLGRGDMLYLSSGSSRLTRVHGGLLTEAELNRVVSFLKKMAEPVYDESVLADGEQTAEGFDPAERDEMYVQAVRTVVQEGKCSITLIQRRLQLGYARAARIVDMMEREGLVSGGEGSKPRDVLADEETLTRLGVKT